MNNPALFILIIQSITAIYLIIMSYLITSYRIKWSIQTFDDAMREVQNKRWGKW